MLVGAPLFLNKNVRNKTKVKKRNGSDDSAKFIHREMKVHWLRETQSKRTQQFTLTTTLAPPSETSSVCCTPTSNGSSSTTWGSTMLVSVKIETVTRSNATAFLNRQRILKLFTQDYTLAPRPAQVYIYICTGTCTFDLPHSSLFLSFKKKI